MNNLDGMCPDDIDGADYDCQLPIGHDGPHQDSWETGDGRTITATWVGDKAPFVPYDGPITPVMELLQPAVDRIVADLGQQRRVAELLVPKVGVEYPITYGQVARDV